MSNMFLSSLHDVSMSVNSKLGILLLLILWNLGLRRTTCYAQRMSDHLKQGDQLNDINPIICSARGSYCLRFMTIDSYSPFYYLTVYSGFLESRVWVANRNDRIINASSEALILDHYGVLKITHQEQEPTILYSPPRDQPQYLINNTTATLLETGNFVLQQHHPNGSNIVLWQSFDYPTDTLLSGMRLGVNHKTGEKWSLVSYFLDISAAAGPFTLEWEPRTSQLLILRRGQVYWASGVLRNGKFENLPEEAQSLYNYTIVSNKDEEYFTFSTQSDATKIDKDFSRWSIDANGRLFERLNIIASAGDCYGYANNGGCQVRDQPACRHKGEFFDIIYVSARDEGITYSTDDNVNLTISDCQATCWNNCHCVGFTSYSNDATGCVFYFENLQMSIPEDNILKLNFLTNRSEAEYKGGPAQAPSPGQRDQYRDSNADLKKWKIIGPAMVAALITICLGIFCLSRWKKASGVQDIEGRSREENDLLNLVSFDRHTTVNELKNDVKKGNLKIFNYESIMEATNRFSPENMVGKGGFGPVYKGLLPMGEEIAIKRLSRGSSQGAIEFKNELILISELQHVNLVQLLGCCIHGEERMLIYEFMPNKSLDYSLFDSTHTKLLDWKKRFNIIEGIAQGLLYLHKYSRLKIVHRDLKASNILLDDNINPKISDFGMAKIFTHESNIHTNRIVGTYGYMSPEYAMKGIFSTKSDVYSFGVLLLEIISGRKNNSFYNSQGPLNLIAQAWEQWKEGQILDIVDPTLREQCKPEQVSRCVHIGLLCVEENVEDRPNMSDVIAMLASETTLLPFPMRPAFCSGRRKLKKKYHPDDFKAYSMNGLSISTIGAR